MTGQNDRQTQIFVRTYSYPGRTLSGHRPLFWALHTTPNDRFVFAPFQGETLNKNPDKLYIFWELNNWRLPYRIYWKQKGKCLKNIAIVLQKYMACNIQFLCSRKWSKGSDKHCAEFLTPLSQKPCRRILISCLVGFFRPVKLRGSKKVSLLFLHLLPPQGFGPEAKTRGGIIVSPAYTYKECVNIGVVCM